MSTGFAIALISVVTLCTILTRAIPFVIFGGKRKVPEFIQYLGKVLPPAIMATLVVYCLKGVELTAGNHGLPELTAAAVVAVLHIWKQNILLTVGLGTVCYMILVQLVFV